MQNLKINRKQSKLCEYCGNHLDRIGSQCSPCNERWNKWKLQEKIKRHESGKCTTCYKVIDREGWFCIECTRKLKNRARIRSAERRLNGDCVQCGTHIGIDLGSYCRACLDQLKERRMKKNK